MSIAFIDTHVHLYPVYPIETLLGFIHRQIQPHSPDAESYGLMLTERSKDHTFESLCDTGIPNAQMSLEEGGACLRVESDGIPDTRIIAGKQMATAEKMEVLALGTNQDMPDGLSLTESIAAAREAGGFPVIPWAPGKWMFGRKNVLHKAIEKNVGPIALSDSAMRFKGFPAPPAFRLAEKKSIPILAGTDPLPHAGEEKIIGRYGVNLELNREKAILPQLINAFTSHSFEIRGSRRNLLESVTAQVKHMKG